MPNPRAKSAPTTPSPSDTAQSLANAAFDEGQSPLSKLMSSRERPHKLVTFPGEQESDETRIAIVALRDGELLESRLDALKYVTDTKKLSEWILESGHGQNILDNEIQVQVLFRALRRPRAPWMTPWAGSANELRIYLEPEHRLYLWNELVTFQNERNFLRGIKSESEVEELVAALGKDSLPAVALSYYDAPSLRLIAISLADRLTKLMRASSPDTSPPTD